MTSYSDVNQFLKQYHAKNTENSLVPLDIPPPIPSAYVAAPQAPTEPKIADVSDVSTVPSLGLPPIPLPPPANIAFPPVNAPVSSWEDILLTEEPEQVNSKSRCFVCKKTHYAPFCCKICTLPHTIKCESACQFKGSYCYEHCGYRVLATVSNGGELMPAFNGKPTCSAQLGITEGFMSDNLRCFHNLDYKPYECGHPKRRALTCSYCKGIPMNANGMVVIDAYESVGESYEAYINDSNESSFSDVFMSPYTETDSNYYESSSESSSESDTEDEGLYFYDAEPFPTTPPPLGDPIEFFPDKEEIEVIEIPDGKFYEHAVVKTDVTEVERTEEGPEVFDPDYYSTQQDFLDLYEHLEPGDFGTPKFQWEIQASMIYLKPALEERTIPKTPTDAHAVGPTVYMAGESFTFASEEKANMFLIIIMTTIGPVPDLSCLSRVYTVHGRLIHGYKLLPILLGATAVPEPYMASNVAKGLMKCKLPVSVTLMEEDLHFEDYCPTQSVNYYALRYEGMDRLFFILFANVASESPGIWFSKDGIKVQFGDAPREAKAQLKAAWMNPIAWFSYIMAMYVWIGNFVGAVVGSIVCQFIAVRHNRQQNELRLEMDALWADIASWGEPSVIDDSLIKDIDELAKEAVEKNVNRWSKVTDIARLIANVAKWSYLRVKYQIGKLLPKSKMEWAAMMTMVQALIQIVLVSALLKYAWGKTTAAANFVLKMANGMIAKRFREPKTGKFEEHSGSSDVSKLHLLLFSALATVLGVSGDYKRIREVCLTVFGMFRATSSIDEILKSFVDHLPVCVANLLTSDLREQDVAYAFRIRTNSLITLSMLPVSELTKLHNAKEFMFHFERIAYMSEQEISQLSNSAVHYRRQLMATLSGKVKICSSAVKSIAGNKPPFMLWLYGECRIGKSVAMEAIWRSLAAFHPECYDAKGELLADALYTKNLSEAYFSGYNGQVAMFCDDVCSQKRPQSFEAQLIPLASGTSPILEQPTVDNPVVGQKGQRFTSSLILCTSNSKHMAPNDVTNKTALNRRRNICVEVTVNPRYLKDGKVDWSIVKGLDHLMWQKYESGAENFVPIGRKMNTSAFLELLMAAYQKHLNDNSVSKNVDEVIKAHEPARNIAILDDFPDFEGHRKVITEGKDVTVIEKIVCDSTGVLIVRNRSVISAAKSDDPLLNRWLFKNGVRVTGVVSPDDPNEAEAAKFQAEMSCYRFPQCPIPEVDLPLKEEEEKEAAYVRYFAKLGCTPKVFFAIIGTIVALFGFYQLYQWFQPGVFEEHSANKSKTEHRQQRTERFNYDSHYEEHGGRHDVDTNFINIEIGRTSTSAYLWGGNSYIAPMHLFREAHREVMTVRYFTKSEPTAQVFVENFRPSQLQQVFDGNRGLDLAIYTFERGVLQKSNRSSFPLKDSVQQYAVMDVVIIGMSEKGRMESMTLRATQQPYNIRNNETDLWITEAYTTPFASSPLDLGDCGKIAFSVGNNPIALGMYVGRRDDDAIFVSFYREQFNLRAPVMAEDTGIFVEHGAAKFDPPCAFHTVGRFKQALLPGRPNKTKLIPSMANSDETLCGKNDNFPCHQSTWIDHTSGFPVVRKPLSEAAGRMGIYIELAPEALPLTVEWIQQECESFSPDGYASVLTLQQAIDGILNSDHITKADMTTAAGLPESIQNVKKMKGKKFLLNHDGTPTDYLSERVDSLIECYKNSEIPPDCFVTMVLKDELLSSEKRARKTRSVFVSSAAMNLVAKMYFGSFGGALIKARVRSFIQLGINIHSKEFHSLVVDIARHPMKLDKDHGDFDNGQEPVRGLAIVTPVNAFYQKYDPQWKFEDDDVRYMIVYHMFHSELLVGDSVKFKNSGLTSGHYLTSIWDSLTNLSYEMSCYIELVPKYLSCEIGYVNVHTLAYFKQFVCVKIYNDDSMNSYADPVKIYMTMEAQTEWYKKYNRRITNGAKNSDKDKPSTVEDMVFLKKTPKLADGVYMPVSDPDTISRMWHWYRDSELGKYAQINSNLNQILRMKFFEGYPEFQRARRILQHKCGFDPTLITYERLRAKWDKEGKIEDSSFQIW